MPNGALDRFFSILVGLFASPVQGLGNLDVVKS